MDAVRAQRPDFFLHLGDTIYADRNGIAYELSQFWAKYRTNRSDTATQRCFHETPAYVVWDDHEVADDYVPGHPLEPAGRKAFLDYWPVRRRLEEKYGIYRSFRWGTGVELFILDLRSFRDPKAGTMLGKTQKEWLFENIARSTALFKFIASSTPLSGGGRDRWDGYPKERSEMLRYINTNKIPGVVFLSADLHYAAITKIRGGLKDITAGPLGAPLNRVTNGTLARYEYYLAENFNFAKITVDPKGAPDVAALEFIDQDNRVFHRTKIRAG
jgi:alkaline phosphatase D